MFFSIRKMAENDRETVMKMMETFYSSPAVITNGSAEIFKADIDNCIGDSPYLEGFVFDSDGETVGYAMIAKSFSTEFGKSCIWIEDIYVKEEYRGRNIATSFFEFIEESYPNSIFRLEAEEENVRAIAVYKKCGFEVMPYLEMKK